MINFINEEPIIPKTYNGILEFINENRVQISGDFKLILRIFSILDKLLKDASSMCDLHKDTRIVLETIKLQLDSFIKDFKNEISLSKMLVMAETSELDEFFEYIKGNSQAIYFVDRLDFVYKNKDTTIKKVIKSYDNQNEESVSPDNYQIEIEQKESNFDVQRIKTRVNLEKSVEFFSLIFDPTSFSQTVKNAFNLALALRMKQVSLKMEKNALVAVTYNSEDPILDHCVFEITPIQYEILKKFYMKKQ